ncbi:hypothetical protein GPALN_012353 [Globodera pallida]|nr:hypothetical protein GPALN_012353 [Globodera pallida]
MSNYDPTAASDSIVRTLFDLFPSKRARPVSAREYQIVRQFVAKSFGEPSPSARRHILTKSQSFFSRLSEHTKSLLKINDVLNLTKYRQLSTTLSNWLWIICLGFSCRVFALMLISLIHSTQLRFICPFERKALIASLDDQFELCQDTALKLIDQIFPTPLQKAISFDFTGFRENTKRTCCSPTPTAPDQLAVQYLLRFLLPRLSVNPNLIRLVQISPQLHAILSAILAPCHTFFETITHQTLNFLRHFLHALLSLCHCAAQLGSTVVHSLSPEGFLPSIRQSNGNFEDKLFSYCQKLVGVHTNPFPPTPLSVICIRFLAFSSASDKFLCSPAKRMCKFCVLMDGADGPAERQRCNLAAGLLEYDIELVD